MRHIKKNCKYCPPEHGEHRVQHDWEAHPSWIAGMEALNAYGDWVSSVVLPIAFQWIEEHKPEVYATVSEELKDDVGTVLAAALTLVKELPAYKDGLQKSAAYEASLADGTCDTSKINPVWTRIVKNVREETEEIKNREEAFANYSSDFVPAKLVSVE